jgi:hypothetical protein
MKSSIPAATGPRPPSKTTNRVPRVSLVVAIFAALLTLALPQHASACACCTHYGQRNVDVVALDGGKRAELESLRFGEKAQLLVGEGDPESVKGIASPSASYGLKSAWQGNQLVFDLRDAGGHAGTLTLSVPGKISIFEVDPRDSPDQGSGPALYKEWKLTGKVTGSGVFSAGAGSNQLLTLIVQGRGNSCTSAGDFSHWTLVMEGPKANYSLFGDLVQTQ